MTGVENVDLRNRCDFMIISLNYVFRVDLSYDNLQYEQLSEIYILTAFGLLAQIGGQVLFYFLNFEYFLINIENDQF